MQDDEFLVREEFEYNPDNGEFTRLIPTIRRPVGSLVGTLNKHGYLVTHVNGKQVLLHRLAFLYMSGHWPDGIVDHKDGDKINNKWSNLRESTRSTNSRNRKMNKNNTSGATGVNYNISKKKWAAYICVNGIMKCLGYFEFKEDAIFARMTAEKDNGYWLDKVWDQV